MTHSERSDQIWGTTKVDHSFPRPGHYEQKRLMKGLDHNQGDKNQHRTRAEQDHK